MTIIQLIEELSKHLASVSYSTRKKILIQRIIDHLSIICRYAIHYQSHQAYDSLIREFYIIKHNLEKIIKFILIDCLSFAVNKPNIAVDSPVFNVIIAMLYIHNNQLSEPFDYFAPYRQTPYIRFFLNASKLVLSPQALYWANPNDKSFATKLCSEWIIKGTTLSLSFLEEIGDPISSTHHTLTETRLYLNQRSTALESIALLKAIKKYAENNKRLIILSNRTSDSAISLQVTAKGKIECYDPNIGFIHFTENDWPEFFSALKAFYRTKRVDMLAIIDPQKSPSYLTHYASTFYYGEKNSSLRIFKSLKEQNSYLSKIYFVIALIFFQLVVTSNQSLSHNTQVLFILFLGYGLFFLSEYFLDAIQLEGLNAFLTANSHPSSNMDTENLMNDNIGPKPQTVAILPFFNGATTTLSKERVHNFMGQIAK